MIAATSPPQPPAIVRSALVHRLRAKHLSVRWVHCYPDAATYHSVRVTRCKVNFGDPHIVQYCAVVIGGRLLTDHERRAIRCGQHPDPTLTAFEAQTRSLSSVRGKATRSCEDEDRDCGEAGDDGAGGEGA